MGSGSISRKLTILDGPMGSQLTARGLDTRTPLWSARALVDAPEVVEEIHRAYARAGAEVHRTNTFRTRRRTMPDDWERWARAAVRIARRALEGAGGLRLAGSVGPLEDCYRPDLAPPADEARREHDELARVLAEEGVDLFVCETFPSALEARIAVEACVATGRETWVSFTAGPDGELMTPDAMREAARACVDAGARAALVNCVAAERTLPFVEALAESGVPFGACANGALWGRPRVSDERYVEYAREWTARGATIVGSCCGTGPSTIAALQSLGQVPSAR
jgi:S-methylmethionine-dependent homocysteine/selenocysteine methylase